MLKYFTVVDENFELSADDFTIYYKKNRDIYDFYNRYHVTLTYNGEPIKGLHISFEINGKLYEYDYDDLLNRFKFSTNENGIAYFDIEEEPGIYPITIRYGSLALTRIVTVKSTIDCTSEDYDPSTSTITATFWGPTGLLFYKRDVKFVVNGVSYVTQTNDVGVATLKLNLNSGENTITLINSLTNENKSLSIINTKSTPKISLSKTINGQDVELTASLNPSDATGVVEFVVSGTVYSSTVKNGKAVLSLKNLAAGSYDVSVDYSGDGKYVASSKSFAFEISKTTPTLTLQITTHDGMDAIMAKLFDITAKGTITFTCNGKDYPVNVVDGISYVNFESPGKYSVDVKYSGDVNFNSVSKSTTVTIVSKDPKFVFKSMTKYYHDSKKFSVRLVDYNGNPLASKYINFELEDKYGFSIKKFKKKTDSNGYVKLGFDRKPSTYYVAMEYSGVTNVAKVIVKKSKSYFAASSKSFKAKSKTKKYTVSLEDKGYYLTNYKVTLKVGGKTYTAKTNSKGKATFNLNKLNKKKTYTAVINFKGDAYHTKATKKVKIKIK